MLSIIIPCYNEESVIKLTIERVCAVMDSLEPNISSELIFVDDGSVDSTAAIIDTATKADPRINLFSFSRNFGHQAAVSAGIKVCKGDRAVILDADLQDPPELIPEMLRVMQTEQAQVVYGVRRSRQGETLFKKATAKIFYRVLNYLSEVRLPVDAGDFRLISREVIDAFNSLDERKKYVRGLTSWVGFRQVPFYYQRDARAAGQTKYNLSRMMRLAFTSVLYFSTKPLRIAVFLGFVSVIFALGLFLWSFFGKIWGWTHADLGWTSLFVVIIFFGGVQLITIGIVGTYVGNIFEEVKHRPEYIFKRKDSDK